MGLGCWYNQFTIIRHWVLNKKRGWLHPVLALRPNNSWRCYRSWHLRISCCQGRRKDSPMVKWYFGLKGRSFTGSIFRQLNVLSGSIVGLSRSLLFFCSSCKIGYIPCISSLQTGNSGSTWLFLVKCFANVLLAEDALHQRSLSSLKLPSRLGIPELSMEQEPKLMCLIKSKAYLWVSLPPFHTPFPQPPQPYQNQKDPSS